VHVLPSYIQASGAVAYRPSPESVSSQLILHASIAKKFLLNMCHHKGEDTKRMVEEMVALIANWTISTISGDDNSNAMWETRWKAVEADTRSPPSLSNEDEEKNKARFTSMQYWNVQSWLELILYMMKKEAFMVSSLPS
jgi:hypothetical protein